MSFVQNALFDWLPGSMKGKVLKNISALLLRNHQRDEAGIYAQTISIYIHWFFSTPEPLGSQGELIVNPSRQRPSVVRLSSVVRP